MKDVVRWSKENRYFPLTLFTQKAHDFYPSDYWGSSNFRAGDRPGRPLTPGSITSDTEDLPCRPKGGRHKYSGTVPFTHWGRRKDKESTVSEALIGGRVVGSL